MKFISTKVHGILDYIFAVVLIVSPWLFGFQDTVFAKYVLISIGASVIILSLSTKYELGVFRLVSMKFHLILDVFLGIMLATSPWVFGFAGYVYLPHLIMGITAIVIPVFSERVPEFYRKSEPSESPVAEKNVL